MTDTPPVPGAVKISSEDMADRRQSTRTKARKSALDVLYAAEQRGIDPKDVMDEMAVNFPDRVRDFTREVVNGVSEHLWQIDRRITACASGGWNVERMTLIDRNLARIAVWEMDYTETNPAIIISEAVELADEFSTDSSMKFLNGLLSNAARKNHD